LVGTPSWLRRALGTPVDVVMLEQAEAQPSLLADVIREGRVLVDRDDLWDALQERRDQILAAGDREDEQIMIDARATFAAARERLALKEHQFVPSGGNISSTLPAVISLVSHCGCRGSKSLPRV
jgi:hypothetical protein